ncbi:MAG: hypothetical protein QUU85_04400, partial [Candidatus Eisenbacteria bacterium]|nr:hypothetical protein [Candidatus Eisenbacteria bacterium]
MSTSRNVDRKPRATLAASLLAGAGVAIAALGLVIAAGPARADYTQHRVVTIDASTAQPLSTGLIGTQLGEEVIFYAEGSLRVGALPERFDEGWFGPAGQTNWTGTGQPIVDGMPYGALIGGFNGVIGSYQFLGRMGSFSVQPADVGQELRLALNLSDADLASLEGSVTITLIVVPPGSADVSQVTISRTTTLPIGTGLFAATGDRFVVLPYGVMRDPALPNSAYTEGWFGPEGLLGVVSGTQPHTGAPYGALFGQIGLSNEYWIGDGGAWTTQPSDVGSELMLTLNTDAVSQAGLIGKFVVNVARIPATDVAGVDGSQDLATCLLYTSP